MRDYFMVNVLQCRHTNSHELLILPLFQYSYKWNRQHIVLTVVILDKRKYGFYVFFFIFSFCDAHSIASNLAETLILGRYWLENSASRRRFFLLRISVMWQSLVYMVFFDTYTISPNNITAEVNSHANTITCHTNEPMVPTRHRVNVNHIIQWSSIFFYVFIS